MQKIKSSMELHIWIILVAFILVLLLQVLILWGSSTKNYTDKYQNKYNDKYKYTDLIGRGIWLYLHAIAENFALFPTTDYLQKFQNHISSFAWIYPCDSCKNDMSVYIENNPLSQITNRAEAVHWMFTFHNHVNQKIGKSVMTREQYLSRLSHFEPPIDLSTTIQCHSCSFI